MPHPTSTSGPTTQRRHYEVGDRIQVGSKGHTVGLLILVVLVIDHLRGVERRIVDEARVGVLYKPHVAPIAGQRFFARAEYAVLNVGNPWIS